MHFLGQNYLDLDNFVSFYSEHSIVSNGVAEILNKSNGNRMIGEEQQVLDAQLYAPTNSIAMGLIQIFFPTFTHYTVFFNLLYDFPSHSNTHVISFYFLPHVPST